VRAAPRGTRCLSCNLNAVRPLARDGRTIQYRQLRNLRLPADLALPTCGACGSERLDAETAEGLSAVLEARYRAELHRRVKAALSVLAQHITQRGLERLLGLSQGYLSRLLGGQGQPSAALVSQLAGLATDPQVRLRELEEYWAAPAEPEPKTGGARRQKESVHESAT
jgi:hypothetical protein